MAIRKDDRIEKELDIDHISSREEARKHLLVTYALEDCHIKTRYYVETFDNGKRIYIERPARLNKGCDFIVYAENIIICKNGNDKAPSHKDVLHDLSQKKDALTSEQYDELLNAIKCIYELKPYLEAVQHVNSLPHVDVGWSYELLLKLLRWLFVEQDITYWADEGRKMLYDKILELV